MDYWFTQIYYFIHRFILKVHFIIMCICFCSWPIIDVVSIDRGTVSLYPLKCTFFEWEITFHRSIVHYLLHTNVFQHYWSWVQYVMRWMSARIVDIRSKFLINIKVNFYGSEIWFHIVCCQYRLIAALVGLDSTSFSINFIDDYLLWYISD